MSIPNYLMALANNKGPATVISGGMSIPVKIMDIAHKEDSSGHGECMFECLVVNQDQIKPVDPKTALNSVYGMNPGASAMSEYVRKELDKAITKQAALQSKRMVDQLEIYRVIFHNPATIVYWADGTKTIVKCQEGDVYSKETGLALCFAKKALGNKGNFNDIFHKWIPEEEKPVALPTEVLCVIPGESEEDTNE